MKKKRFLKPQKTRAKGFDLLPWNYKQVGNFKLLSHLSFFTVCCDIFSWLAFQVASKKLFVVTIVTKINERAKHLHLSRTILWFSIKVTNINSNFLMVWSLEIISFFYLHFSSLYGSWNHQGILEKHPFQKYNYWFPLEVSKLTSVKYP